MTIYYTREPDWSHPKVRAVSYQEWIVNCWRELPFTVFHNGQFVLVFNHRNLPALSGIYAVSALLHPHHLELPLIRRWGKPFKVSEYLPYWVNPDRFGTDYEQLLYIGQSENLRKRWGGHNKIVDFCLFLDHGIEMKFRFYAEPPSIDKPANHRTALEKQLVQCLRPLLNFH